MQAAIQTVLIQGKNIEYIRLAASNPTAAAPPLVFLHEGLGSIAMWRDFPQRMADATGCAAIVYSRYGYGGSDPLQGSRDVRYMHDEALLALPELLDKLKLSRPVLIGHSDGGSIALIHAGAHLQELAGIIVMAPHVIVETISVTSIAAAKTTYQTTDLRARLARYHAHVDSAFRGWNDIWLHPDFLAWNIDEYVAQISCPLLAIQGLGDEYGTLEQIDRIARLATLSPQVALLKLENCRHSPHKDQPEAVIRAAAGFISNLPH